MFEKIKAFFIKVKDVIMHIWQGPQSLIGFIIFKILDKKGRIVATGDYFSATVYTVSGKFGGVSLGEFIFLSEFHYDKERTIAHEYGHSRQSKMLGPFYLLVVGAPSGIMNILTRIKILKPETYYTRWPETWADKLGDVVR